MHGRAVTIKVKTICRRNVNQPLQTLIRQLNPAIRGWCVAAPGVSAATFADLANYTPDRFMRWARRKHRRITVKAIRRRHCNGGWWPTTQEVGLFNPDTMRTTRYRYRGAAIPTPWPAKGSTTTTTHDGTCEEPGAGTTGTPGSRGDSGKPTGRNTGRAPRVDLTHRND